MGWMECNHCDGAWDFGPGGPWDCPYCAARNRLTEANSRISAVLDADVRAALAAILNVATGGKSASGGSGS
ncbi:hypothetical protein PROPHIGD02-2_59 [Mycobacterium phage prophiGD02-2]|nr:hypothetical protein PROPHIGD02-2_59 [Mycobacterium phage prophiGD02-2]QST87329.1 hypothetical protein PROPHIGD90-1_59 [Mycobacterium phage prophiGD90-1]CPZ26833.1 Uncharacterised protein [Mycobacteroides abscessus]